MTSIPVGNSPRTVDVNEITNKIYVANNDGTVSVIDGTTNTVIDTITTVNNSRGIAVNEITNRIYVSGGQLIQQILDYNQEPR